MTHATALIAEDEPLLAQALQAELARSWPALRIVATVSDGISAVNQTLALRPDVLFLDIRMPGQSGLDAAAELADRWDGQGTPAPFPALVFVTAYDQYAIQAFEAQALDYVLKPVQPERLARTVRRLQSQLAHRLQADPAGTDADAMLGALRQLLAARIQASVGSTIRMVPIDEVLVLEASDKYVCVHTASQEYLLRTPLKELVPQLDPERFWQVHRGTVVRADAIESVLRDESGRLSLSLRGHPRKLPVSRLYAHRFRPM